QIFWFGDLNYRLNMEDADVRKLIFLKRWDELISNDQLNKELRSGHVFEGWKEGVINFPPTYKYEINSDRYFGENPKEGEKKRSPACQYRGEVITMIQSIDEYFLFMYL
ncbi:type I inositol polyphosphate 5-phosphatase 2-like, partial [Prunus avium]|uniref:Type I inositol polyphosphate 5-phosphatase 2-like n=1 Tax=Prunus avium TaxID=42229 RepID=A0A6P5TYT5_PRUAV